jgi:hypothetical protein
MGHYAKMGIVVMRSFGLLILLYATPVIIWGIARMASGATVATDGRTPIRAAFLGWVFYGLAGLLLFALAKPLGRMAARGLDEQSLIPPGP